MSTLHHPYDRRHNPFSSHSPFSFAGKRQLDRAISPELKGMAWGLMGVVAFGLTLPLTRYATAELPPLFIGPGRAAVAGIAAALILFVGRQRLPARQHIAGLLVVSACIGIGFPLLVGVAMSIAPASHGGVIFGVLPLGTAIISAVLHGDRPSAGFWLCGVIGGSLVALFALGEGGGSFTLGDLMLVGCVALGALGYAVSGQLAKSLGGWRVICWGLVFALPFNIPAAVYLWPENAATVSHGVWVSFAYLALVSQLIGFFWWNKGLAMGGVARVSQIQLVQPFITLLAAGLLLGELPGWQAYGFAFAVVIVVGMGSRQRIRRAAR